MLNPESNTAATTKSFSSIRRISMKDEAGCKKKMKISPALLPGALSLLGEAKHLSYVKECNDENHKGRIRSFPHERGNWATHIFISVNDMVTTIEDAGDQCKQALENVIELQNCEGDLHLSLSKTFVLQYHLIDSFVKSLIVALDGSERISLGDLKIYVNEEHTRTFVAFAVDGIYYEKLKILLDKIDTVLKDYKLPLFYKPPSFHVSFLWCLGDKVELLRQHWSKLTRAAEVVRDSIITVNVDTIKCKSGNKEFNFSLS